MRSKRIKATPMGLNLTSMIDVVFLLLIYFMVATEFKTAEESFPMDLPKPEHAQRITLDSKPLVIVVESAGETEADIRIRLEGPWDPIASVDELTKFLQANKAGKFSSSGLFSQAHPILIKPTSQTRWDHTIATYNAVARADYINITLEKPL
jgi:biopolymer transport protein ExbD